MNGYSTEDKQTCSQINNSYGDKCYQKYETQECAGEESGGSGKNFRWCSQGKTFLAVTAKLRPT